MVGSVVRVDGTIRYWMAGDASAGTVVCTHGATLDHGAFAAQVPVLCNAGYRVIRWDLRGHGASRSIAEPLRLHDMADDLLAVLDDTGVERAMLVGQSFGGFVAQDVCRRAPERVSALVLVGTPPLGRRPSWPFLLLQRTRPFVLRLWPEGHLRRMLPVFMSRVPEVRRYVARATRTMSKAALIRITETALEAFSYCDDTETMGVPTLFACGEREDRVVLQLITAWAASDPLATYQRIPDAGHLANQDNPAAFNDALLAFCAG